VGFGVVGKNDTLENSARGRAATHLSIAYQNGDDRCNSAENFVEKTERLGNAICKLVLSHLFVQFFVFNFAVLVSKIPCCFLFSPRLP
jgi:hypothetical protein